MLGLFEDFRGPSASAVCVLLSVAVVHLSSFPLKVHHCWVEFLLLLHLLVSVMLLSTPQPGILAGLLEFKLANTGM